MTIIDRRVPPKPTVLLRLPEVMRRVGYSRPHIWRKIALGEFPRPLKLGSKAIAWVESEIEAWIAQRIEERDNPTKKRR